MNKPLLESAYPEAPFFRQSYGTALLGPLMLAAACFLVLGSLLFYGFGVLIHIASVFAVAFLLIPVIRISNKRMVFQSPLWAADLLFLAAMLPVSLPWYGGLAASAFYLVCARVLFSTDQKQLFNPLAVTFIFILNLFPYSGLYGATVFHVMDGFSIQGWLEASYQLISGVRPLKTLPFFIGGTPGGSLFLVVFTAVLLGSLRAVNFSIAVLYLAGKAFWLFVFSGLWGMPILSAESLDHILNSLFLGVFLLSEPSALEYPKKLIHALLAASFTAFLHFTPRALAPYYGVLAAGLCVPLLDLFPRKRIFGSFREPPRELKEAFPPWRDTLLTILLGAGLALAAFLLREGR